MMKAILSCTADDLYSFNLPFAVYSWYKLGIDCVVFVPLDNCGISTDKELRFENAMEWCSKVAPNTQFEIFVAPPDKIATYAQCARLYAAAIPGLEADILITTDADMCVFNQEFWDQFDYDGAVNIIGVDLVPEGQVPMCYITSPLAGWYNFMEIKGRTYQECLDDLLGGIEAEHFRGNYWGKDQETAGDALRRLDKGLQVAHFRAVPGTQFATRRADRDGWQVTPDIIDAHLPRPGHTDENFAKIFHLFETMYPVEDYAWMERYREEYLALMK